MMKLHSSFLLNSQNVLLGKIELVLMYFNSLLTITCGDYLMLLGQSQNEIELLGFLLKNSLRFSNIVIK